MKVYRSPTVFREPAMPVVYAKYIRSPEWKAKRTEVILRAQGKCERCGLWPIVNVHHLTYARLGDEDPTDLLGVCSRCHTELHEDKE
jgi:5-methylcytosine-specific restriction endonuclease McrA